MASARNLKQLLPLVAATSPRRPRSRARQTPEEAEAMMRREMGLPERTPSAQESIQDFTQAAMKVGMDLIAQVYDVQQKDVRPLWVGIRQDAKTLDADVLILFLFNDPRPNGVYAPVETQGIHVTATYKQITGEEPLRMQDMRLLHWHGQFVDGSSAARWADKHYKTASVGPIIEGCTPDVSDS